MRLFFLMSITWLCLRGEAGLASETKPIDYQKLDFSLTLDQLRAGNHDETGINDYKFKVKLLALLISKDELRKAMKDRTKIERELGRFSELKIESLKYWIADKKKMQPFTFNVSGDALRDLTSEAMRAFQVPESQLSIYCVIEMIEDNKRLRFFGEDTSVGEMSFSIIPDTLPHVPRLANRTLALQDPKGTFVEMQLQFKAIVEKPAAVITE